MHLYLIIFDFFCKMASADGGGALSFLSQPVPLRLPREGETALCLHDGRPLSAGGKDESFFAKKDRKGILFAARRRIPPDFHYLCNAFQRLPTRKKERKPASRRDARTHNTKRR